MNAKRFHLTGHRSSIDKLFVLSNEIPIVLSSWPFEADPLKGYIVQLSPTLKSGGVILEALAKGCGVQCAEYDESKTDMYGESYRNRKVELNSFSSVPTPLSEFSAGYTAALRNVKEYGLERVQQNAASGIPK